MKKLFLYLMILLTLSCMHPFAYVLVNSSVQDICTYPQSDTDINNGLTRPIIDDSVEKVISNKLSLSNLITVNDDIKTVKEVIIKFNYDSKTLIYKLSNNINGLSKKSIGLRGLNSPVARKEIVSSLMQLSFDDEQIVYYLFPNIDRLIRKLEESLNISPVDASAALKNNTFTYKPESVGRMLDNNKLFICLISHIIKGSTNIEIDVPLLTLMPRYTLPQIKENTVIKSTFSTNIYGSKERTNNIRLASSKFNGYVLGSGQLMSFNELVGERTADKGYETAKIIIDGKYTDGIGGGVCQVSSTIYNACLLSGLKIVKVNQHSLLSSYVPPSLDAMVNSSSSDLVVENNTPYPIYFSAVVANNKLEVKVYGSANKYKIKTRSEILKRTDMGVVEIIDHENKYANYVKYTDETYIIEKGHEQITSKGYLQYYLGNKLIKEELIRTNTYKGNPTIIIRGTQERPKSNDTQ